MKRHHAGFTLVELMIVVAIIGVLAALATYSVGRYLKTTKVAEAGRSLGAIENGARQQFQREVPWAGDRDKFVHTFCDSAPLTPTEVPKGRKATVPPGPTGYDHPGWTCLKFVLNDPQFFAYQHTSNGLEGTSAIYTANAFGDLDGNGTTSNYELVGRGGIFGDAVRVSMRVIDGLE